MTPHDRGWPAGDGEMAGRVRSLDWAATALGSVDAWPERLKGAVELVLASPLVSSLVCGADGVLIYNDAASRLYGDRHPAALGRPLPEAFPEGWATVRPFYDRVFDGESVTVAAQPLDTRGEGDSSSDVFDAYLTPVRDAAGAVIAAHMVGLEIGARLKAEAILRESEARQRALIGGLPQLVWRSCDRGEWTWASPQWLAFTGQRQEQSRGRGWLDVVHPDDREATMQAWEAARPQGGLDVEYRIRRGRDGIWVWHRTRSVPVRDETGRIIEWLGTSTDVDDLRKLQGRQGVLVAELQHRTRNLLGVVRSIAGQTMRRSDTLTGFEAAFNDRLGALSRVQGLLSRSGEAPITMGALIHTELDALGAADMRQRVIVRGPEVRLHESTVQTFALALHELATNACKYGALSNGEGRLSVTWKTYATDGGGSRLALEWREVGLDRRREEESPVTKPAGYGRELIEQALPYMLQARTRYELGDAELHCTIDLPLTERGQSEER